MATRVEPIDLRGLDLDAFAGRPVAVLGLARSGVALCRFLADRGAHVTAYDARPADALEDAIAQLEGRDVALRLGPHVEPQAVLEGQALVCTSPSVSSRFPTTEPRLRAALARVEAGGRVPVVSEIDLFLRLCPATVVGITGTKGKTTTSTLSAAVLERGDRPVVLGGNIGTPLIERVPELTAAHRVVLELSELQLPTLSRGCRVAVYTHVTQDHLDRHGSVEAYRAAKRRLAELTPRDGRLVLNAEDPVSAGYGSVSAARPLTYRRASPEPGGVGIVEGWIAADRLVPLDVSPPPVSGPVLPLDAVSLPGAHSLSNVLAAVAVGLLFGVPASGIRDAVAAFRGVEHRLEPVAEVDGVLWVNDSQGTQPDAVVAALRAFPDRGPLVLIAGGQDKGVALDDLAVVAAQRASAVVLIGENAPRVEAALRRAGHRAVERAASLEAAVRRADELIHAGLPASGGEGGVVLLSPAAASFDMFTDYAARGRAFKAAVAALSDASARTSGGGGGRP